MFGLERETIPGPVTIPTISYPKSYGWKKAHSLETAMFKSIQI